MELASLKNMGTANKYVEQHSQLHQCAPVNFQHDHGCLLNQLLHNIKGTYTVEWISCSAGLFMCTTTRCNLWKTSLTLWTTPRPKISTSSSKELNKNGRILLTTATRRIAVEEVVSRNPTVPCRFAQWKPRRTREKCKRWVWFGTVHPSLHP